MTYLLLYNRRGKERYLTPSIFLPSEKGINALYMEKKYIR